MERGKINEKNDKCQIIHDKCRIFVKIIIMKKYLVPDEHEDLFQASLIEQDGYEKIQMVREGIPYYSFEKFASLSPLSMAEWSEFLEISERSLHRYKKDNKKFDRMRSERIMEIARVLKKGVEVFGDQEKFTIWMNSRIIAIGGIKPRELLDSSLGIKLLDEELTRIDYGMFG
jgi:putative toxin-antitoxin system antitoxin component (TIGR02293 family)